jgi:hypothetical protein
MCCLERDGPSFETKPKAGVDFRGCPRFPLPRKAPRAKAETVRAALAPAVDKSSFMSGSAAGKGRGVQAKVLVRSEPKVLVRSEPLPAAAFNCGMMR